MTRADAGGVGGSDRIRLPESARLVARKAREAGRAVSRPTTRSSSRCTAIRATSTAGTRSRSYKANVLVALETTPRHMQEFARELEDGRLEGVQASRSRSRRIRPRLMKVGLAQCDDDATRSASTPTRGSTRGSSGSIAAVVASRGRPVLDEGRGRERRYDGGETAGARIPDRHAVASLPAVAHSGACFIGKTESLRSSSTRHSLWTPGEDIETGRIAYALRLKIRHADFVVRTEVPDTWAPRCSGSGACGGRGRFATTFVNADRNLVQLPVLDELHAPGRLCERVLQVVER